MYGVAVGGQCGPDGVEYLAGCTGQWGEQVDVLRRPAQQAVCGQRVPAGKSEALCSYGGPAPLR